MALFKPRPFVESPSMSDGTVLRGPTEGSLGDISRMASHMRSWPPSAGGLHASLGWEIIFRLIFKSDFSRRHPILLDIRLIMDHRMSGIWIFENGFSHGDHGATLRRLHFAPTQGRIRTILDLFKVIDFVFHNDRALTRWSRYDQWMALWEENRL